MLYISDKVCRLQKGLKIKKYSCSKSIPACASSKSLLFRVTRQWLWFPSPSTISPVELLTSGIEYKKKLGWNIIVPLWMEQHLCVPWKLYNIPYGMEVVLLWYRKSSKTFMFVCQTHLPVCGPPVFLTKKKKNLSKEWAQVLVPHSGLWRQGGKGIIKQNFASGKAVTIIMNSHGILWQ